MSIAEMCCMQPIHHSVTGKASSSLCLVFIHGMLCDQSNWTHQIQYFKSQYQILTLDLPGHGESSAKSNQHWDVVNLAAELKQFLTELNLNKQLVIVAHSASVRIALELNYLMGEEVAGLVLLDCGYQTISHPDMKQWLVDLRQKGYATWLTQFFSSKFGVSLPSLRETMLQNALDLDPAMGEALYLAVKTYDYYTLEKCLKLTTVPVLVLQSSFYKNGTLQSASFKTAAGSEWLDLIKSTMLKAQIQIMPHCGHWIMLEQPDACNQAIEHFVQHLTASPAKKRPAKGKGKTLISNNFDLPL